LVLLFSTRSALFLQTFSLCQKELVWRVFKLPNRMAIRRPLNEVVNKFENRRGCSHSLSSSAQFASASHIFNCLRTAAEISSY
jgi:hypothetical protein